MREKKLNLERELKLSEGKLNCNEVKNEYNFNQENLNAIYDEIAAGIIIRSRCNWYELGEKSNKFSLNLEKYRAIHSTIRKVICDAQEITDRQKINNHFFLFYKRLFEEKLQNDSKKLRIFERYFNCITDRGTKGNLSVKEIYQSLIVFKHGKQ